MVSIAIDGPSGAGKSTVARAVSQKLGYVYVDTGALYRAVGLWAACRGLALEEEVLAPHLPGITLDLDYRQGEQRVILCGEDVSGQIRSPEMSMAASKVSSLPLVRAFLLETQREMARRHHVVMDGRDIGTVVLPQARVKIFLTASLEDRARRRMLEYRQKGREIEFDRLVDEMRRRDYDDSHRVAAPLCQAPDAVLLDTTGNELEQSIAQVMEILRERGIGCESV